MVKVEIGDEGYVILEAVRRSLAGESLTTQRRWTKGFGDERDSLEVWDKTLGRTTEILSHMGLFASVAIGLSSLETGNNKLTYTERRQFWLGCLVHDVGEAVIDGRGNGDIEAHTVTELQKSDEHKIGLSILEELDLPWNLKIELIEAYKSVEMGGNPKLGAMFKTYEMLEYVMTALQVYQMSLGFEKRGLPVIKRRKELVARVVENNVPQVEQLITGGGLHESAGAYLERSRDLLAQAYEWAF